MKKFLDLFIPLLLSNLTIAISGLVDTVYLSHFNVKHVAVLSVTLSLYSMVFILGFGLLQGMMQTLAEAKGRKELHQSDLIIKQGVWVALSCSAFGAVLLSHAEGLVLILGAEPELMQMINRCLHMAIFILPAQLLLRVFFIVTQTCGQARLVFYTNVLFLILKLVLSGILIFGLPSIALNAYGVYGAYFSTLLSYWLVLPLYYVLFMEKQYQLKWNGQYFDAVILKKILRIGIPTSVVILIDVFAFTSIALLAIPLGAIALTANQIISVTVSWLYGVTNALIATFSILVSIKMGEGNQDVAWQLTCKAILSVFVLSTSMVLILFIFKNNLVVFFTADADVAVLFLSLFLLLGLFHIADAMLATFVNMLRCWHVTLVPMLIYSVFILVVGLGGGWYFAYHPFDYSQYSIAPMGIQSFWLFATFAYAMSALVCGICLKYRKYLK